MKIISIMLVTALSLQANASLNSDSPEQPNGEFVDAVPLDRPEAIFPKQAAARGREGWVQLSYVVNEKGVVESAVVERSSGDTSFERSALNAVKKWRFKPAMQNNKPVKQCKNQVQLTFFMPEDYRGVSRPFLNRYKKIVAKIDKNDLESVPQLFHEMKERKLRNFTEDSYFWVAKARYYAAKNDRVNELRAIVRIIQFNDGHVPDEMYIAYLSRAIVLNMEQNKLKYALSLFERLSKLSGAENSVKQLAPYIDKVHELVEDDSKHIWVKGEITRSLWRHKLARNAFTISDIKGDLTSLEIRCDNHYSKYEVQPQQKWSIPASWRGCQVYIHGGKGAHFSLIETPQVKEELATKEV
ncbi:energy transducer TonB [Pseudoalteromonas obscura]|uniref:Energy transducer TonB n=1 Tax=Pseudoalteromonas obscura TaxID=3048491 RepID=A0ABT7EK46_9GAMM|nr:energy transducer TonB [Pseudoalteromonas sp. P94(2023)]MDK2595388.1 energy transducer TonB [Pseudoalteromonas sp. P94(2023)]